MEPLPVAASVIIRSVIDTIENILPPVTDDRDQRSLRVAVDDLVDAVNPALWRAAMRSRLRENGRTQSSNTRACGRTRGAFSSDPQPWLCRIATRQAVFMTHQAD